MRKLNVRASPGFDCIAAPFIKYAEREVPAANGSGVEKMNVLAPYFARLTEKNVLCPDDGKSSDSGELEGSQHYTLT